MLTIVKKFKMLIWLRPSIL